MRKGVVVLCLALLLLPSILAVSIDSEIRKITYYAEEYETGNIDYVQLLIYMSAVREKLNNLLGATSKEYGGILKQEQLEAVLGEPQKRTKWVWDEREQYEKKIDSYVPVWEKIIFDGKKIQIRITAYPSLFDEEIVYRLNFDKQFKKPKDQIDISSKIDSITPLAEEFAENPTLENGETLAKESVTVERTFDSYMKQNPGQCVDIMKSLFGSENQRQNQELIVQEVDLYAGDDFQVMLRLEMCDECEWNWISLNPWVERRGGFFEKEEKGADMISFERYGNLDFNGFEMLTTQLIEQYLNAAENRDFKEMTSIQGELWAVTEAWNRKSNDIWQEVEKEFYGGVLSEMNEEEQITVKQNIQEGEQRDPYYWIKEEQRKRQRERELRRENYEKRKTFYLNLFANYDKQEFYFEQVEFEKRLVELFKESGKEICNNNIDDNNNEQVDCEEDQCSGKICGQGEAEVIYGNETKTEIRNLYCISGVCQAKEEIIEDSVGVCGNHICEQAESETCPNDCVSCMEYPPLECDGKVIFKGTDENGCPLEPICLEEVETCTTNEECPQPLCGISLCVKPEGTTIGKCEIKELMECREAECVDGTKKIMNCENEEIVMKVCQEGVWRETGLECTYVAEETELIEEISGEGCNVKEDCGGENDVCSNGKCVAIPEIIESVEESQESEEGTFEVEEEVKESGEEPEEEIEEEPEEAPVEEEPEEAPVEEEPEEGSGITGGAIFNFFKRLNQISIPFVKAEENVETTIDTPDSDNNEVIKTPSLDGEGTSIDVEGAPIDNEGEKIYEGGEKFEFHDEGPGMEEHCKERCERECYDMKVRPCIDICIKEECGYDFDCNVNEVTSSCESTCKAEADLQECQNDCEPKCLAGEETWEEPEWEELPMELGVFTAGGGCRTSQGQTEAFIWLNGWGDPFDQLNSLKQQYYEGGEADWCKYDLENLEKQRREFEKGFNEEFVIWFFEDYLANSAEEWEQHVSGIFEVYWSNVDNIMQMAHRMQCLGQKNMEGFNLINLEYETEYGSIEYWEEMKTATVPGVKESMNVITPYMKIWIFPSKEFIKYEMKKSMENHELPGPSENKMEKEREEGLTDEQREELYKNEGFMRVIKKIADKYGGTADIVVQIKDFETGEVVYNVYVPVNEEDIFKLKPMLPSEVPEEDIRIEVPFEQVYDLIYYQEKEMRGAELEFPPWDKHMRGGIKKITNGIKMSIKIKNIIKASTIYPEEAADDAKDLAKLFFKMMKEGEGEQEREGDKIQEMETEVFEERSITGDIIQEGERRW